MKIREIIIEAQVGAATLGPGGRVNVSTTASSTLDQRPKENEPGPTRVDMPKDELGRPIADPLEPSPFGPEDLAPGLGLMSKTTRLSKAAVSGAKDLADRAAWAAKDVAYKNFPPYKAYLDSRYLGGEVGKIPGAARPKFNPYTQDPINRAEALLSKQAYDYSIPDFVRGQMDQIKNNPQNRIGQGRHLVGQQSGVITQRVRVQDPDATLNILPRDPDPTLRIPGAKPSPDPGSFTDYNVVRPPVDSDPTLRIRGSSRRKQSNKK